MNFKRVTVTPAGLFLLLLGSLVQNQVTQNIICVCVCVITSWWQQLDYYFVLNLFTCHILFSIQRCKQEVSCPDLKNRSIN